MKDEFTSKGIENRGYINDLHLSFLQLQRLVLLLFYRLHSHKYYAFTLLTAAAAANHSALLPCPPHNRHNITVDDLACNV